MEILLALALAVSAAAAPAPGDGLDAETRLKVAKHVLETPTNEANPTIVKAFLAMDLDKLPKKLRPKARAKKLEVETIVKIHSTKMQGGIIQPVANCTLDSGIKKIKEMSLYAFAGFEEVQEEEIQDVSQKTLCTELDMVCQFSLMIFTEEKKPRKLMLHSNDPLFALIASSRNKSAGGQTKFFGAGGITCSH